MDKEPEDLEELIQTKDQLDVFLEKIRQEKYIAGKPVSISFSEVISVNRLKDLADAFSSGKMPPGSIIHLARCNIEPEGTEIFATALQSGNWPSPSTLNLAGNSIGNKGAIIFANAIQSGKCAPGLALMVGANQLSDDGIMPFAEAIQSGKCPPDLTLSFYANMMTDKSVKAFTDAFCSGKCPPITISLTSCKITIQGLEMIANALQSKKCPAVNLGLSHNRIDVSRAKLFADAFSSGKVRRGSTLQLRGNNFGYEGIKLFAEALRSGGWPIGSTIDLHGTSSNDDGYNKGIIAFANAIQSGNCPEGVTIKLGGYNTLGTEAVDTIVNMIKSGNFPNLDIDFTDTRIGDQEKEVIANAMKGNTKIIISGIKNANITKMNERNRLIRKYPELEGYIKEECRKNNLFEPHIGNPTEPLSLKATTALFFHRSAQPPVHLPQELQEFLDKLKEAPKEISNFISKPD